ncbi:sensor histidine kinase [Streptomyces albus subsp. chlorinus]|uniref:sensor histidine kinase n=1 Tax=Streptomyces albus TaxID=1888 RepID=UPI001570BED3|nr:sensor histidine kinase [Streptomyces albus]NSC21446.1 sensor histidine kinase [Streptomyces albus subsp. chlorinus]
MTTAACAPPAGHETTGDEPDWPNGHAATRPRGPGKYSFLPWLLMGLGAFSHTVQGKGVDPWLGGAALLAFNSLYILVVFSAFDPRRDPRTPLYGLAGLTVVTFAVALGLGGAWTMYFPLLSLASGTVRSLRGKPLAVWLIILSSAAGSISGWDHGHGAWSDAAGIGYGTFVSGMVTAAMLGLFDTVRQLEATRQELARTAVERERLRFSRDLHDLLGHTLSVIVVKAEAVRRLGTRDLDAALAQAADIEAVGRQALTEIREAVSGYREGGLGTELERAGSVLEAAAITPVVRRSGPPLPPQTEALLGWVVRECVTNTVRHSGAGRCEIEVRADDDRVRLTVTDDGRGTGDRTPPAGTGDRTPPVGSGDRKRAGTGLTGLAERLAAAGGTLDSGPDGRRGFRVVAELPVDTSRTEGAGDVEQGADTERTAQ